MTVDLVGCAGCGKLHRPERLYILGVPSDPPTVTRLCPACFGGAVRAMIAAEDVEPTLVGVQGRIESPGTAGTFDRMVADAERHLQDEVD